LSSLLVEHDLFRKPVSTFRDHALALSLPVASSNVGVDALRLHPSRAAALASFAGGLAGRADASAAVAVGAVAVLCGAARRRADRACGRTRIPARHRSRSAAGLLA